MRTKRIIVSLVLASAAGLSISCTEPSSSPSSAGDIVPSLGKSASTKIRSVAVSPSSSSIVVGATQQLTATTTPTSSLTFAWSSSNNAVATVDQNGLVTGAGNGTATISASAGGKTGTASVSVTNPVPPGSVTFVGAGDIASCSSSGDEATATLLDGIAGTVFLLGDNVYDNGTASEYTNCYNPSWGRHKARTKPVPGNHEYNTVNATGYYGYFGALAGDPTKGYYSYDLGDWHIIALNSNLAVAAGSTQEQWLRADLAASTKTCTLAYWHHPRFSSGFEHGNNDAMQPLWQALYDANADVILNGHDHDYERFAPQTPTGAADGVRGIREFVVGTGGKSHYSLGTVRANSEVFNGATYGVLKMTLSPGGYAWEFVHVPGTTFTDSGTGSCH